MLSGLTSKEIADRMKISPNTVNAFLLVVIIKIGVSTGSRIVGEVVTTKCNADPGSKEAYGVCDSPAKRRARNKKSCPNNGPFRPEPKMEEETFDASTL
jgi:hypothetical protein